MKTWEKLIGIMWLIVGAGTLLLGYKEHAGQLDLLGGKAFGVLAVAIAIPFLAGAAEIEKNTSVRLVVTAMMIMAQLGIWSTNSLLPVKVLLSAASILILYKGWRPQQRGQSENRG